MPSLRQTLAAAAPLLVIDASSPRIEAAVWLAPTGPAPGTPPAGPLLPPTAVAAREGEASCLLPRLVAEALAAAGLPGVPALRAVAFCDGPGSLLGIRLCAVSARTWRVVRPDLALFAFHSLPLLARAHPALALVADARRDSWHLVRPGEPDRLHRVPSADLAALGPVGTPAPFRRWSSPPPGVDLRPLPWSAAALLGTHPDAPLLTAAPEPDALVTEAPVYASWTPRVHQAPAPR